MALFETLVAYSYPGFFLIGLASSSTLFLPLPIYTIIFASAQLGLNPLVVGIATGIGAAIGELTGYFVGEGGRLMLEQKKAKLSKNWKRFLEWMENNFEKYGLAIIAITAFLPFPFDIVGIIAGINKYSLKKFLIATIIGKTAKMVLIAYAGVYTIPLAYQWFLGW